MDYLISCMDSERFGVMKYTYTYLVLQNWNFCKKEYTNPQVFNKLIGIYRVFEIIADREETETAFKSADQRIILPLPFMTFTYIKNK